MLKRDFTSALDGVAQVGDVGGGGVASVDEGEGVAGGDSGVAQGEAFREASLFEQPCSGEFDEAICRLASGEWCQREMFSVVAISARMSIGNDGVFEEGAGAAAVGFAFDDQHSLAVADGCARRGRSSMGVGLWPAKWRVRSA